MKCLILAAGYATRLYPLTEKFPKPLLKVGDKTIIDWLIDDVASCGIIDEFIVVTNHKYIDNFQAWKKNKKYINYEISLYDDGSDSNDNRLGAVRDIKYILDSTLINEDLLVLAGDNVLDFSLGKFIEYAQTKNASCVMCYKEDDISKRRKTAIICVDNNQKIISFIEKPDNPESNLAVPPFYFYKNKDIIRLNEALNAGCNYDAPGDFAAWLSNNTDVYAYYMPGSRYDIGNLESYENVKNTYRGIC